MMAKTDRTQAFRNFLLSGKSVEVAAASAGIAPDELDGVVGDLVKDRKLDTLPMAHIAFDKLMGAVETLDDICRNGEDERAQVSAAKALLDFAVTAQKLRIGSEAMDSKTPDQVPLVLWDFS
jgi:hypothetical protein